MSLYGTILILVAEAYNQFRCGTVKPVVQLTPRPFRITDVFAKALIFTAIGLIHAASPAQLRAQTGARADLRAVRITTPPKLDGILDDEAWSGDPLPLDGWISYNPMRGEAAAEKTQVWVGYDAEAVYFAFRCLDTQPDKIRTTISRRDNAFSDDWVGVSLDSSRAGQLAYHLFVNPSGIQMDALQSGSTGEDFAPDWVWQSAGHVSADGWSAEIRVPLENIRFRSGADVRMGVLFWRRLSRTGVSASWPEMPDGKWVFESNASDRVRRAAVTTSPRDDSERHILGQPGPFGSLRVEPDAGERRLRREREVWVDVRGHPRCDGESRLQSGGKRRLRGRGQPALPDLLQRKASVLHGRFRDCSISQAQAATRRCERRCTRGRLSIPAPV